MLYNQLCKRYYISIYLLLISVPMPVKSISLEGIGTWFPTSLIAREEVQSSDEYQLRHGAPLTIQLIKGSITVETWGKPYAMIQTTKRARSQEDLADTHIIVDHKPNVLSLQAVQPHSQSLIDLTIIIPATSILTISIMTQGDITIKSAPRTLKAHTNNGTIRTETHTDGTIQANTDRGTIVVTCDAFSAASSLLLTAPQGSITLALPPLTQARLEARTQRGSVISELPITFEPFTTKIDKNTWKQLSKYIKGTIGDGEAPITLKARDSIIITQHGS